MLLSETDPFLGLKQIFLIYCVRALENWNYWIVLAFLNVILPDHEASFKKIMREIKRLLLN